MRYLRNAFIAITYVLCAGLILPPVSSAAWPFGAASKTKNAAPAPAPASQTKSSDEQNKEEMSEEERAKEQARKQVESVREMEVQAETAGKAANAGVVAVFPKTPRAPKVPNAKDYNLTPGSVQSTNVGNEMNGVKKITSTAKTPSAVRPEKFHSPVQGVPAFNFKTTKAVEEKEIAKIQDQIKDILKLNESLKTEYTGQSAEIQKIGEQAKIHQKILQGLQETPQAPSAKSEELLQLEKIRVIKQETEENHRYMESLKESNTQQQGTDKPVSQKVAV